VSQDEFLTQKVGAACWGLCHKKKFFKGFKIISIYGCWLRSSLQGMVSQDELFLKVLKSYQWTAAGSEGRSSLLGILSQEEHF
jgi:hypothetical protein